MLQRTDTTVCLLSPHLLLLSMGIKKRGDTRGGEGGQGLTLTHLKTSNAARQHDGLTEIIHQGLDDKEQGVGVWETGEIFTAVIVHNDLLPVSLLQRLLPLFGSREVCQAGFALLQSLAIESIAAVDINGSFDMAHVVGYERSAV